MTKEEFITQLTSIEDRIEALKQEKRAITDAFINANCIYRKGDKIEVTYPEVTNSEGKRLLKSITRYYWIHNVILKLDTLDIVIYSLETTKNAKHFNPEISGSSRYFREFGNAEIKILNRN